MEINDNGKIYVELETERLILRSIVEGDLDDIYEYAQNDKVGPEVGWKPHESKEMTLQIMKDIFFNQENVLGIVRKEDSKLIGTMSLLPDLKREDIQTKRIGYALGEPYWDRGYTTEAGQRIIEHGFEDLELDIIAGYCHPFNHRHKRILEKLGLTYEGTLRKAKKIFNGSIYDVMCFSITKEEYYGRKINDGK